MDPLVVEGAIDEEMIASSITIQTNGTSLLAAISNSLVIRLELPS